MPPHGVLCWVCSSPFGFLFVSSRTFPEGSDFTYPSNVFLVLSGTWTEFRWLSGGERGGGFAAPSGPFGGPGNPSLGACLPAAGRGAFGGCFVGAGSDGR